MSELTDDQKAECQRAINYLVDYWWNKIEIKMNDGMSFQVALQELQEEMLNEQ